MFKCFRLMRKLLPRPLTLVLSLPLQKALFLNQDLTSKDLLPFYLV